MIKLGLERISRLLRDVPLPWDAFHVAGTNGKGSVCAYIDAMLRTGGIRTGRFLSPHLIDRWDGITINNRTVDEALFRDVENGFLERNRKQDIQATPFEILTATAFQVFATEKVQVAVIECGMGGLQDATNVLRRPLCTVITHIALDHVKVLGPDIESIARQKAGIAKINCPMVVAGSNTKSCIRSIEESVSELGVVSKISPTPVSRSPISSRWEFSTDSNPTELSDPLIDLGIDSKGLSRTEAENMILAFCAVDSVFCDENELKPSDLPHYAPAMLNSDARLRGRYQSVSIEHMTGRKAPIIVDGAHNENSWTQLRDRIEAEDWHKDADLGQTSVPITWIIATGNDTGKAGRVIEILTRPGDRVFAAQYGPVDGMPQAVPASASEIEESFNRAYGLDGHDEVQSSQPGNSGSSSTKPESSTTQKTTSSSPQNHSALAHRSQATNTGSDIVKAIWQASKTAKSPITPSEAHHIASSQHTSPQSPSESWQESPIIVTGSLYLCADVLRIIEKARDDPLAFSRSVAEESGVDGAAGGK